MTIQEIEARTGLERSNIRFYEREGLLCPARLPNGYRDYGEADAALLLKIKLLRRLGLSLEDIRALQKGEARLDALLERRYAEAGEAQRELEAARELCHTMRREGAEFSTLDAPHYLAVYESALREVRLQPSPAVPASDRAEYPRCPWRRYFAKAFDLVWIHVLFMSALALGFRVNIADSNAIADWLVELVCWCLLFPIEGLLISRFSTTPGKWILGLRYEHAEGRRLYFHEAAWRCIGAFGKGEGFCIPIYNLYRNYKSYKAVMDGEGVEWDADVQISARDMQAWRPFLYAGLTALCVFAGVVAALIPAMPRHKGAALTVEQFVENYNQLAAFHNMGDGVLQTDGSFRAPPSLPAVNIANGHVIELGNASPLFFRFKEEDGILTEISFERKIDTPFYIYFDHESDDAIELCAMAFAWADASLWEAVQSEDTLSRFLSLRHEPGALEEKYLGCRLSHSLVPGEERYNADGSLAGQSYWAFFSIGRDT